MRTLRRIATAAVAAGIAFAAAGGAAGVAFADGPNTPAHVESAIEAQPWVELNEGESGYRVVAVGYFLNETGHYTGEPQLEFGQDLTHAVRSYQEDSGVPVTGAVDAATWDALSDDVGTVAQGDQRSDLVEGLQHSLYDLGYDVTFDGQYGPATEKAVRAFQESKGIDADGIVGPITFRAMYAKGAQG